MTPPLRVASGSRGGGAGSPAVGRLFLPFVEDPARVERQHWETQLDAAVDGEGADVTQLRFVAASENGELAGEALDGQLARSAGLGVLLPMSDHAGFVSEADYDGARFDELDSRGRVSAGVNWSPLPHGTFRAALAY